jgi:hypothetical protein
MPLVAGSRLLERGLRPRFRDSGGADDELSSPTIECSSAPTTRRSSIGLSPSPIGTQVVVGEFTTADSITIPRHLRTHEIRTYMTLEPLKDLDDPDLSPPPAQTFLVEVVARAGSEERRAVAKGRDIYAITAPLVVEATQRVVSMRGKTPGVFGAGEIFEARDFLKSLCPAHLTIEIQ